MIVKPKNQNIKRFVPLRNEFKVNIGTRTSKTTKKSYFYHTHLMRNFNQNLISFYDR